ncbi:hypothetical protein HHI36_018841, partial [Cryptolaemus montrouzieri]
IYRRPSGNTEIFLYNLGCVLERVANYTEYKAAICGDFNIRSEVSSRSRSLLLDLMGCYG